MKLPTYLGGHSQWSSLIDDLREKKWSQAAIGRRVGCHQSHISDLYTQSQAEPRYSVGERLKQLHAEVIGQKAAA